MIKKRKGAIWAVEEVDNSGLSMKAALMGAVALIVLVACAIIFIRAKQTNEKIIIISYASSKTELSLTRSESKPDTQVAKVPPPPVLPPEVKSVIKVPVIPIDNAVSKAEIKEEVQTDVAANPAVEISNEKPAPQPPVSESRSLDIGVICRVQEKPIMPRKAQQENISGSVLARAVILGGKVISVEILKSTPKGLFDAAVKNAMFRYQCDNGINKQVVAEQAFEFKLD